MWFLIQIHVPGVGNLSLERPRTYGHRGPYKLGASFVFFSVFMLLGVSKMLHVSGQQKTYGCSHHPGHVIRQIFCLHTLKARDKLPV